ncbi:transglycosylase domain-containing protein [Fusobacterium sp. PH5-44]|uniref:transglycosylase domain-containing protein n=1 Tax=unclassified Fusobacterium TaxID=2648384 RepID=UPI003D23F3AB
MKKLIKKFLKWGIITVVLVTIIGGGVGIYILNKFYAELPDIEELIENYAPSMPTTVYDRNNNVIDILFTESRDVVSFKEVPDVATNAFLAIEDKKFYEHHGIHPKRVIGAIVANLKAGRTVQGASSITQQLAKNAFLTNERTLKRKILEAIITVEIERRYTKGEILEKYLNEINFGSGLNGIKTATKHYFKKDVSELTLAEAALLAGIPNSPGKYNPRRNIKNSMQRAHLVLREMKKDGRITEAQYEEALEHKFVNEKDLDENFVIVKDTTIIYDKVRESSIKYPDFTNLVVDYLINKSSLIKRENIEGKSQKEIEEIKEAEKLAENNLEKLIYSGGLKIYTTLDIKMQDEAKRTFDGYSLFKSRSYLNGGMITVNPNNGHVISIVGGKNFKSGNFNRAIQAKRQVGSSFKPFLYFFALLNGMETTTVIEDSYFSQGKWTPKNFGGNYFDNITLQNALDRSLNIVSIKLLRKTGTDKFQEFVKKINPDINVPNNLTAALGSFEASPLQMATAFAIFSNGGYVVEPVFVTTVEDRNGNVIYTHEGKKSKTFDSIDTSVVTSMLSSSVARGSSARAAVVGRDKKRIAQGGKTGTTNRNRTVWYVGITPDYVTAIYVGRDGNEKVPNITGGTGAAPLWKNYYQNLINKGLYFPSEFSYLDNHLKNSELIKQYVDPKNGFVVSGGREYIVRATGLQLESAGKYSKGGIGGVLGIDESGFMSFGEEENIGGTTIKNDPIYEDLLNR